MTALTVQLMMALQQVKMGIASRLERDERGQTATEYTGILVLIALILVAIFALGLDSIIANALKGAVNKILKQ